MGRTVIEANNLRKEYRLGELGTGTISRDVTSWWAKVRGKEDPNTKIGETLTGIHRALTDVSFSINEGDVVGIIGKNGAGKSTLLKILSRITLPTDGSFKVRGRIASLLEVGTGFHPELTGRENIFLNGAILGMNRQEIKNKFDEIVDFSGVEKFIDTPVKRYSSGMYVRLAFAVAAHLEPEILIVDEVLAVGDAEFQEKCLGKMREVSTRGRTVLFVSHNMQAVAQLCKRGIVLDKGTVSFDGDVNGAIKQYLAKSSSATGSVIDYSNVTERKGNGKIRIKRIEILNKENADNRFMIGDDIRLRIYLDSKESTRNIKFAFHLYRYDESIFANVENTDSDFMIEPFTNEKCFEVTFPAVNFYPDVYKVGISIGTSDWSEYYDQIIPCFEFNVIDGSPKVKRKLSTNGGFIYLTPEWKTL